MRALINYLQTNAVDALILGSSILLVYVVLRRFAAHPIIAFVFSISPLMGLWAYQNLLAGRWVMPQI